MLKLVSILFVASTVAWCGHGPERQTATVSAVTVLLDFDEPHSESSLRAMEREVSSLLREAGVQVRWRLRSEGAEEAQPGDLVSFRVRGHCSMQEESGPVDELGPMAMAYTANGTVLHFGEVECDRVKIAVRRRIGADAVTVRSSENLLGRALGRVMAHEMYHILGNETGHTKDGVTRKSLTASDLTCPKAQFPGEASDEVARQGRAE